MRVKPAPGRQVTMPDAPISGLKRKDAIMPAEGADVPRTQYWRRRLADGAVVLVEPEAPPAAAPATPATAPPASAKEG